MKVDLMEDLYDHPMVFDEAQVPPYPVVAWQGVSAWGKGVAVYGTAKGYRCLAYYAYTDGQHVWL